MPDTAAAAASSATDAGTRVIDDRLGAMVPSLSTQYRGRSKASSMHQSLRLSCDRAALARNYHRLERLSSTTSGAAIKANGYGLGAADVADVLLREGCRDFFVSTWWEASELASLPEGSIAVLHGFGPQDVPIPGVRPVLISSAQIRRWKESGRAHLPCDVMIDTGMNRLGIGLADLSSLDGLALHTLHSHLACADEESPLNNLQLARFAEIRSHVAADRYSLANSAGIFLGTRFSFDLVRPGLALYGGIPREEARGIVDPVFRAEVQIVQVRQVPAGSSIGYNATFVAQRDLVVGIANVGYGDGFLRAVGQGSKGHFRGSDLPIVGRISMDLVAFDASQAPTIQEGDWVELAYDLELMATLTGLSQYELLTGLGRRWERRWS